MIKMLHCCQKNPSCTTETPSSIANFVMESVSLEIPFYSERSPGVCRATVNPLPSSLRSLALVPIYSQTGAGQYMSLG